MRFCVAGSLRTLQGCAYWCWNLTSCARSEPMKIYVVSLLRAPLWLTSVLTSHSRVWLTSNDIYIETGHVRLFDIFLSSLASEEVIIQNRFVPKISDPYHILPSCVHFWYSKQATTSSKHRNAKAREVTDSDSVHAIASRAGQVSFPCALYAGGPRASAVVFLCMVTVGKRLDISMKSPR